MLYNLVLNRGNTHEHFKQYIYMVDPQWHMKFLLANVLIDQHVNLLIFFDHLHRHMKDLDQRNKSIEKNLKMPTSIVYSQGSKTKKIQVVITFSDPSSYSLYFCYVFGFSISYLFGFFLWPQRLAYLFGFVFLPLFVQCIL